jgi:hypothetical protein
MDSKTNTKSFTMPTLFPANPIWGDQRTIHYRENTSFTITYFTEKKALEPYLPDNIIVPENPLMMVSYCMCRGVEEMGGTGYNLVSVGVGARYEGKQDKYDGDLSLVIWENKFPPVVMGREFVGYPKLVVEIDDPWMGENKWGWRVSENGTCFLEGEVFDLVKMSDEDCGNLNAVSSVSDFSSGNLHMAYKVFPGANYNDDPITAHVCGVVHRDDFKEAWTCKGSLKWHPVTPESCYLCYGIIDSLSKLPILKYDACMVTRGSHVIELGNSRRLV